ncbi:MAG: PDR/VanB family oxidoreductase [Pseudonocardia sp.]|nr:PDR/VanB family oxidoreductase [Pseudonocardia sp.]
MSARTVEPERELVVHTRAEPARDVVALTLRDPDGAPLPEWAPGAHVDLLLDGGPVRQYSLCGDPADTTSWRVAVLREPAGRGGSARVHETLHAGATVRVRGPRNHFALEPAGQYVFVAGGIGITPILPMLAAADAAGARWRLTYGGRTAASMAFAGELRAAYGDRVTLRPQDEYGVLELDAALGGPDGDTLVYCCGPEPLLEAVEKHTAPWPAGRLRVERFVAQAADGAADEGFEVELAGSGEVLEVPAGRSVLEVLEAAGAGPLSSCREGTCGTCETGVVSGTVDHRDALLSADERAAHDTMFVCVSRAACPRLVLDL